MLVHVAFLLTYLLARLVHADSNQTQAAAEEEVFSCEGRPPGYYADVASDCQRYHQCDGGRRFTHSCPDMTRFQQRMMVCDHWYAVDCSTAHADFGNNLLIGRRHMPFLDRVHLSGRRRVLHRGRVADTTTAPRVLPETQSSPAERQEPRITFRYVKEMSPNSRDRSRGGHQREITTVSPRDDRKPSVASVHFGSPRHIALPEKPSSSVFQHSFDALEEGDPITESTTLTPATSSSFLAPLFARRATTAPPVAADPQEYVEVRISDPRLMFYIPESGDENDLETEKNSTVVIHLDHHHTAMMFRPGGRALAGGRNPLCPNCLPAFLAPGLCQPCVTVR